MGKPAFQRIGSPYGALAPLGTCPLGTAPLGGGEYPLYILPDLQPGSNLLTATNRTVLAGITHERDGLIVGHRQIAERPRWKLVWKAVPIAIANEICDYARARRFYLLQDSDVPSQKIVVFWRSPEDLNFPLKRGRAVDMDVELEAIIGPYAAE